MGLLPVLASAMPSARARGAALGVLLAASALPAAAHAHIQLESSAPATGAVLAAPPARLRLRFSAHIEPRYTSVTVERPDGTRVALDGIVFEPDSDREFTVRAPHMGPGSHTVHWRTAGADGHVLEGSFSFTIHDDTTAAPPVAPATHSHDEAAPHAQTHDASAPLEVFARWLHFMSLIALLGAMSLRALLLPRIELGHDTRALLQRRAWRALALAALALAAAATLRLWLQSVALHGSERAWSPLLLSIMLTDTSWGRAWLVQAVLFALLGAGIAWARPPRDRLALVVALIAVCGLATIPAASGHAAGAERAVLVALVNDSVHVIAAGAWIGTLALLTLAVLPALHGDPLRAGTAARAVDAFSPLALAAAAIVIATGVINALLHLSTTSELWTTAYGRTLGIKVALVALVFLAGAYNWRVARPRLRRTGDVARLRRAAAVELAFALAVLTATAILTGLPRP